MKFGGGKCLLVGVLINVYCYTNFISVEHCQFPLYMILWFWAIMLTFYVIHTDFYKVLHWDLLLNFKSNIILSNDSS
jgi:hypothetical protein